MCKAKLKVIFMGTPDFAVPALDAIVKAGHEVVAVYCQPPARAGRGKKQRPSQVHRFANELGLPVLTPKSLKKPEEQHIFASHGADIAVVAAYGLILPEAILQAPRLGCLNIHASLLPRWRGAAPIHRAIMAGDTETGVNIMQMDAGLDTGPVCLSQTVSIAPMTTAGELHDQLSRLGSEMIVTALEQAAMGKLKCQPQPNDGITYAHKIDKAEARIDFSLPAQQVANKIHGLSPWPGAWFLLRMGDKHERIKILLAEVTEDNGDPATILDQQFTIACARGAIRPAILQRAGKKPMTRTAFLRGFDIAHSYIVSKE